MPDSGVLFITAVLIICLNIPFGYWRANVRKFGLQWFLAIHLPVPGVIFLRYIMHTGWHWSSFVFFVTAFFLGQLAGGFIHHKMTLKHPGRTSSCLFADLYRIIWP